MACNSCSTANNGCGLFDSSNLLLFFLALCALSGSGCSFSSGNELLIFFLIFALLFSQGNTSPSCGTC